MLEILLVDDDPAVRMSVACALTDAGHHPVEASDGEEAIRLAAERAFDVAICDVRLPKVDGLTLFRHLRRESPGTAVILMTAFASVSDAVAALREGAYDYVTKPFDPEEFTLRVIGRISERRSLRQELEQARAELASRDAGAMLVGHSPAMVRLLERLDAVAQSDAPVLVSGETGTGKELVARTVHGRSARRAMPFVTIHCGAFPEALLEAELFGGLVDASGKSRLGKMRAANRGTLLLDDVDAMPMATQAKLVRVLSEGMVEPIGLEARAPIDVRIMSTTHRDPKALVAEGKLREDLFYRLQVLDLHVPPLRERRADLPMLLQYFLKRLTPPGKVPPGIAPRAWTALNEYPWPGNVREFGHAIERALVLAHGSEIDLEHLPPDIVSGRDAMPPSSAAPAVRPLQSAIKDFERQYLLRTLHAAGGRRGRAAELLGISRKNLWEKLRAHGISGPEDD